jgi:hypothetical protein
VLALRRARIVAAAPKTHWITWRSQTADTSIRRGAALIVKVGGNGELHLDQRRRSINSHTLAQQIDVNEHCGFSDISSRNDRSDFGSGRRLIGAGASKVVSKRFFVLWS